MTPLGPDIALRAVGAALASVSIAFAGYMFAYGGGEVRVVGMEHLAIFAKPRGPSAVGTAPPPPVSDATPVDMAATGSVPESASKPAPPSRPDIIAARADRIWLRIDRKIVSAAPGEEVPGLGRIGAIARGADGWTVRDAHGATLLRLAAPANGAALFSRKLIFD